MAGSSVLVSTTAALVDLFCYANYGSRGVLQERGCTSWSKPNTSNHDVHIKGCSGAEITSLCQEAAMLTMQNNMNALYVSPIIPPSRLNLLLECDQVPHDAFVTAVKRMTCQITPAVLQKFRQVERWISELTHSRSPNVIYLLLWQCCQYAQVVVTRRVTWNHVRRAGPRLLLGHTCWLSKKICFCLETQLIDSTRCCVSVERKNNNS